MTTRVFRPRLADPISIQEYPILDAKSILVETESARGSRMVHLEQSRPRGRGAIVVIVLMGVSGSGKTTVGKILADQLGWTFVDADDYHPAANVEKMRRGIPLNDDDRRPWLDALRRRVDEA